MRGAIILAGGQSKRMGRAKADLMLHGKPFLGHVVETLAGVVGATNVVVVRAADQLLPTGPKGVVITADRVPGRGPLEGFAAGLAMLSACESLFFGGVRCASVAA